MKNNKFLIWGIIIIFSWLFLILYFLASTDVYHDYISRQLLTNNNISISSLPAWTSTSSEWSIIYIDYAIRILFTIISIYMLYELFKNQKSGDRILTITFISSVIFALLLIPYTLAFTSIFENYGGSYKNVKHVIDNTIFNGDASCTLEWKFIQYELLFRLLFMLSISFYFFKLVFFESEEIIKPVKA